MSRNSKKAKTRFGKTHNVRARSWAQRLILGFLVLVIGGIGVLQSSTPARANIFSDALESVFCGPEAYYAEAQPYASGIMSLGIGSPILHSISMATSGDANFTKSRHTAYEKYGVSGANFTVYRGGNNLTDTGANRSASDYGITKKEDPRVQNSTCVPVLELGGTTVANMIFGVTKIITSFAMWVYGMTYQPTWIETLNNTVATLITGNGDVKGLRDTLYFPFLNIIIMFGALYLAWVGLFKKQSVAAGQAALWMIGAVFAGSLLMFNPKLLPTFATDVISLVNRTMMNTTTGIAVGASGQNNNKNFCSPGAPQMPAGMDTKSSQADNWRKLKEQRQSTQVVRIMECNMWATFVYAPWVGGQWGVSSSQAWDIKGTKDSTHVSDPDVSVNLGGGKIVKGNYALYQLEQQSLDVVSLSKDGNQTAEKEKKWYAIADDVMIDRYDIYGQQWSGKNATDRIGIATLSVVASGAALATVVVLSLSVLVYTIGMSLLVFASVLFLLVGAHPGFGRGIALRWAELIVGTFLKIIFSSAMLGVLMAFYAIILQSDLDYGPSIIAVIALSIAGMMYRKTLTEAFTTIHFNGSTTSGLEGGAKGGVDRIGAGAMGLAIGAVGAMGGAGKAARAAAANPALKRSATGGVSKLAGVKQGMAAASAGTKAMAAGAGRGAKFAAVSGKPSGFTAIAAMKAGKGAATDIAGKAEGVTRYEQDEIDPSVTAGRAREAVRRAKQYERDYKLHHNNPEWVKDFKEFYGFEPPNPAEQAFPGYGVKPDHKTAAGRRAWAAARPVPRADFFPEDKHEGDDNGDGDSNGNNGGNGGGSGNGGNGGGSPVPRPGGPTPVPAPVMQQTASPLPAVDNGASKSDPKKDTSRPSPSGPARRDPNATMPQPGHKNGSRNGNGGSTPAGTPSTGNGASASRPDTRTKLIREQAAEQRKIDEITRRNTPMGTDGSIQRRTWEAEQAEKHRHQQRVASLTARLKAVSGENNGNGSRPSAPQRPL